LKVFDYAHLFGEFWFHDPTFPFTENASIKRFKSLYVMDI